MKRFFAWAMTNELVLIDPFEHARTTPLQTTIPPYLTQDEVRALLEGYDAETQLRDRAVFVRQGKGSSCRSAAYR